jgi:hypothetical protein
MNRLDAAAQGNSWLTYLKAERQEEASDVLRSLVNTVWYRRFGTTRLERERVLFEPDARCGRTYQPGGNVLDGPNDGNASYFIIRYRYRWEHETDGNKIAYFVQTPIRNYTSRITHHESGNFMRTTTVTKSLIHYDVKLWGPLAEHTGMPLGTTSTRKRIFLHRYWQGTGREESD